MNEIEKLAVEVVATGLGWPEEGSTVLPDGRIVIVESYRSQLTAIDRDGTARQFAYVAGAPNACVLGSDGLLYVCQNGGTTGPWRAAEMTTPSIQRVAEGGKPEILLTEVAGIRLNGPNDLVFAADGRLYLQRSRDIQPQGIRNTSYIFAVSPDGSAHLAVGFDEPTFPWSGDRGGRLDRVGQVLYRARQAAASGWQRRRSRTPAPGANPIPDGLKVGADGRLYVTDIVANGIHVLKPDGTAEGFFACGKATTNCVFSGEMLWVTNAGVLATGSDPSFDGTLCRMRVPGGGGPTNYGRIGGKKPSPVLPQPPRTQALGSRAALSLPRRLFRWRR